MTRDVLPPEPPFPPTAPTLVVTAAALRDRLGDVMLIDCRRRGAFDEAREVIAGAVWRDPEAVLGWMADVPGDRAVVVYCKYGHEVSLFVAGTLRARGYDVQSLAGGIAAWTKDGGATQPKG
ncbi:MAG TPA: rhodanese-like domain-containing protein [Alphaproteobacteria bacterium]